MPRRHVLVFDDDRLGHALEEQNRLAIAADARRIRLDDAERERHGDAGVDDVAAFLEHQRARLRRERVARRDDRARGLDVRLDERLLRDHLVDDVFGGRGVLGLRRERPVLRRSASHAAADGPVA